MRKMVFVILFLFVTGVTIAHADIVIIIHGKSDVTSIDKNIIKDIFLGKKTKWNDDTQITFITLKEGNVHKEFLRKAIKKSPAQFKNFWRKQLFLGKTGKLPVSCESIDDMITRVSANPGSIGYISSTNDLANQNIKQILILH